MNQYIARLTDLDFNKWIIILHEHDASKLGLRAGDRARIFFGTKSHAVIVSLTSSLIQPGEVGLSKKLAVKLGIKPGNKLIIRPAAIPPSLYYIKEKIRGKKLSAEEINSIVRDVVEHNLGEVEIAAFLLAEHYHGMSIEEIEYLTIAIRDSGEIIEFEKPVYDKHSIGGIPGNKVSLLIVPIVAAAGLLIPKTSSRAITSPAGTADTMEVLAPVEFTPDEVKEIATKVNGCIVWGGALNIAPADDIFVRVEHSLMIDPLPQMVASIMAKKLAVGANYVVIDIPIGKEAKVETMSEARALASLFIELGRRIGITVRCGITYGGQPVGHAVGPALEAKEAMEALMRKGPASLVEKSTALAGMLLEMAGIAPRGMGKDVAKEILRSGKALRKMREIIEAQGGDPNLKPEDIPIGDKKEVLVAPCDGFVTDVSNNAIARIARAAGAPEDKGAGVYLKVKKGYKVERGNIIMEIYAESETKLAEAYNLALQLKPITIEGMLLAEVPEY